MTLFFFLIILIAIIVMLILIRYWLNGLEKNTKISEDLVAWLKSSATSTDQKLSQNMSLFNDRLDNAARVIGDVQKSIGQFAEIGRSMQELQEFLSSPKLRGNIGEQVLKELLSQYFPPQSYELQHAFKNGEKVDAVLKLSHGLLPIDSKFPMENFRKYSKEKDQKTKDQFKKDFISDVKKHIIDIAKKYIMVDEQTVDYALMYIPSESIYYEIINTEELFDFAGDKRVLPVSPLSFYAYMKAILMSYEGQKIQKQAKDILNILKSIKKDYERTDESVNLLSKHLTNAYNQASQVSKNLNSLGQKLSSTNLLSDPDSKSDKQEKLIE
jgi:DNA recombination protein RmuC